MKKTALINSEISRIISRMGHTDGLVIADCGLPVPAETERIDLALVRGTPTFMATLEAVLGELAVEEIVIAEEMLEVSPKMHERLIKAVGDARVTTVSHETFKQRTASARAVIRTGDCTPYANVILVSGVAF